MNRGIHDMTGLRGGRSQGGGLPIGSQAMMAEAAHLVDMADGSQWLMAGALVSSAGYDAAAKLAHLAAHGNPANTNFTNGTSALAESPVHVAHDGNGTMVVCLGAAGMMRSTDFGQTWANVASYGLSIGGPVDVIWAGNRFLCIATNTTSVQMAHSATGASGTWTLGTSVSAGGVAADFGRLAYNPGTGTVMATIQSGANNSLWRCTANSTFTAITSEAHARCDLHFANGAFVLHASAGSSNCAVSTNDGVSFSYYSPPAGAQGRWVVFAQGRWLADAGSSTQCHVATANPTATASWTLTTVMPPISAATTMPQQRGMTTDGVNLYVGGGSSRNMFYHSADGGITWRRRHTVTGGATQYWRVLPMGVGGVIMFVPSAGGNNGWQRTRGLGSPEYIGIPYIITGSGNGGQSNPYLYSRIK